MAEGAAFDGTLDLARQRALEGDAFVEGLVDRSLHGIEQDIRRIAVLERLAKLGAAGGDGFTGLLAAGDGALAVFVRERSFEDAGVAATVA